MTAIDSDARNTECVVGEARPLYSSGSVSGKPVVRNGSRSLAYALPLLFGFLILLGLIGINYLEIFVSFPSAEIANSKIAIDKKAAFEAVDKIVSMLITIIIGMFIIFGFVIKLIIDRHGRVSPFVAIFGGLFIVAEVFAVNSGYFVRAEIFDIVVDGRSSFEHVQNMLGWQALFTYLGFVCAIIASAHVLLVGGPPESSPRHDGAKPSGEILVGKTRWNRGVY